MDIRIPLGRRQGSQGLVSCGAMKVHSPLEPEKQCQSSCRCDHRDRWLFHEVPQGCYNCNHVLSFPPGARRVIVGESGVSGLH